MQNVMPVLTMPKRFTLDHTPEWHTRRRQGIGGSESAAVLGESKWTTPYQIWRTKTGRDAPRPANEAMEAGITFEPAIREWYSNKTGRTVYDPGFARHEKYPFIIGNVDGICEDRILEIKNSGNEWDTLPTDYFFQVQHYMYLHNKRLADVAVVFRGQHFKIFTVEQDLSLWDYILPIYADFWRCVETDTPPDLSTLSDVDEAYRNSKESSIVLPPDVLAELTKIKTLKTQIAELEDEKAESELAVKKALKDNAIGTDANGKTVVTWRKTKSRKLFDSKQFKERHPEMYDEFITENEGSRPFLVK